MNNHERLKEFFENNHLNCLCGGKYNIKVSDTEWKCNKCSDIAKIEIIDEVE